MLGVAMGWGGGSLSPPCMVLSYLIPAYWVPRNPASIT